MNQGSRQDGRRRDELARRMAAYYRSNAAYHEDVTSITGDRPSLEERRLFGALREAMPDRKEPRSVLEVGCGRALSAHALLEEVGLDPSAYVGVDPSPSAIQYARSILPAARFLVGDGSSLPFQDGLFDAVVLAFVLEHSVHPDRVLREAVRVLRPGGAIALIAPVSDLPWMLPQSLRPRANDLGFALRTTAARWLEAARIRHQPGYFSFRLVEEPAALADPYGLAGPDEDQVYWGWSFEIAKFLERSGCEIAFREGRPIDSVIRNGRRVWVDVARTAAFLLFRLSAGEKDRRCYTTTASLVAVKAA